MAKNYPKEYFELVQDNERLTDKALKTKQLTYLQDAMVRFKRNTYNVVATIILSILIILSIIVPMITPEELYTETNSQLITLPPRVPLIEKLGILDGTKEYEEQPIDLTTIDPETGLGYPTNGFQVDFIDMDSLVNYEIVGSERDAKYVGGTNILYINNGFERFSIYDQTPVVVAPTDLLTFDIIDMDSDAILEVYFLDASVGNLDTVETWDEFVLVDSITSSDIDGPVEVSFDGVDDLSGYPTGLFIYSITVDGGTASGNEFVEFNSITYTREDDTVLYDLEGYELSTLSMLSIDATENGRYLRSNAVMTVADFRYDEYAALFADQSETIGEQEYLRILEENPGMEEDIFSCEDEILAGEEGYDIYDTYCTEGILWVFVDDDGVASYPLTAVSGVDNKVILGTTYTNYAVMKNGKYALGFDSLPYFLFGTDVFGKDLFTLIWLGLRTSLLLGFLASLTNILIGVVWGAISAYYGGQVDILMERFTDIWASFPQITMISIITVIIGPGFWALYIFMIYAGWIGVSRVTRMQFYRYKGREYVLAARTLGATDRRIIFKHILPNALGTIVTRTILSIPTVIFLEVNLSYLGFGIGNGQTLKIGPLELTGTSIGVILNDGQQQIFAGNLWLIIFPTIIVSILMITFNMFGNALRDALNPQLRGGE